MTPTRRSGFTLIEVICCLTLLSITASLWGVGLYHAAEAFFHGSERTATIQKGQIAVNRLVRELRELQRFTGAVPPSAHEFTYLRRNDAASHHVLYDTVTGELTLDGDVLLDRLDRFHLTYYDTFDATEPDALDATGGYTSSARIVGISLAPRVGETDSAQFKTRVFLRGLEDAP